ncbi:MAG: hypothetical protein ACE5OY_00145 [Candidatus Bathyarchaeia archaeon]
MIKGVFGDCEPKKFLAGIAAGEGLTGILGYGVNVVSGRIYLLLPLLFIDAYTAAWLTGGAIYNLTMFLYARRWYEVVKSE